MFEFKRTDGVTENAYMQEVFQLVQRNMPHIRLLDKNNADEIASRVISHAVTHRNRDKKQTLNAYIRSLANTITKGMYSEQHKVDWLDDEDSAVHNTVSDSSAWTEHEIAYDAEDRRHLVELITTQYLLTPSVVSYYCANALCAVGMNNVVAVETAAPYENVNSRKWEAVEAEMKRYSAATVISSIIEAAQCIAKQQRMTAEHLGRVVKEVDFTRADMMRVRALTEKATVFTQDSSGENRFYCIDRYNFDMRELNGKRRIRLDFTDWLPVGSGNSVRAVYAVDISPLVNYIYERIAVPEGITTAFVKWLGHGRNIRILPSGKALPDVSEDQYFIELRAEILSLLSGNTALAILGITEDTVYIRPARRLNYNCYRCRLFNGHIVDLPLRIHNTAHKAADQGVK